ncbi:putative movement protein [abaca bunchy top virus]|uniref:Movement protein n=1 Tax=Babuvirus abacae TaxID=438782 RepID=B0LBX1_9VIRU|nr:putative movement protein [Abaca bunchy top virus]
MALTGERVKQFFEWFLFFAAIFVAISIIYILLAVLLELPKYIKGVVKYIVEYVTRRRVWMRRTQLTEATGGGEIEGDRHDSHITVMPSVPPVSAPISNRRGDQGLRPSTGPMF